jgi:molybdopterin converting factor small subunit
MDAKTGEYEPAARSRRRDGGILRDLRLGVSLGLAATGIAAATWTGVLAVPARLAAAVGASVSAGREGSASAGAETITVRVRPTGSLRWIVDSPEVEVQVPKGTTVAGLSDRLGDRYPGVDAMAMLAVSGKDDEMLPLDAVLTDGEQVDLVSAMAGG